VRLHRSKAKRDQFAVMRSARIRSCPTYTRRLRRVALGGGPGGGGGGIQFMIQGPDLAQLEKYSDALLEKARAIPGLVDVDTTLNAGKPEMSVLLDRPKASDLGVQVADAAEALRLLVAGDQVTTFNESGEQYEVHLRAEEGLRGSREAVAALPVPSTRLGIVTLDNIATFEATDSPATISRMGRQRQVTLNANMLPGTSQATAQEAIAAAAPSSSLVQSTAPNSPADRASSIAPLPRSSRRSRSRSSSCT
jgi:HAE1 family hydrophobic/amphiphilic exporter-1